MEKAKSVGIWIRVSTEDQAQGDSPEHHEKRARLCAPVLPGLINFALKFAKVF